MLRQIIRQSLLVFAATLLVQQSSFGQMRPRVLQPDLVHLRSGTVREWSSFPEQPEATHLEIRFSATKNAGEVSLRLRQQDVKQAWRILLNGKSLGELVKDENDQILYLAIPAGGLIDGDNVLRIESPARAAATSDDIRVGEIWIDPRPRAD